MKYFIFLIRLVKKEINLNKINGGWGVGAGPPPPTPNPQSPIPIYKDYNYIKKSNIYR
jgi:hypothetical protein